MQTVLTKTIVNGLALWLAALALPGIRLGEEAAALSNRLLTIVLVALVFGLINAVIKPIISFLSLPFLVLTLGLFTVIINAIMLSLTSAVSGALGLDFDVAHFFWDAVVGSLIISFVSMLLNTLIKDT